MKFSAVTRAVGHLYALLVLGVMLGAVWACSGQVKEVLEMDATQCGYQWGI